MPLVLHVLINLPVLSDMLTKIKSSEGKKKVKAISVFIQRS